jgi:hypothetical protein
MKIEQKYVAAYFIKNFVLLSGDFVHMFLML